MPRDHEAPGEDDKGARRPMPAVIGRYRVRGVLGSGAFATVYRARDEGLDDEIAIKVLAENWAHDPDVRSRFISEARLIRRLQSDHVVRVLDIGETEGKPYFVMELADRGTLADRMEAGASTEPGDLLDLARSLARALAVLHGQGIVHRDVKPANILIRTAAPSFADPRPDADPNTAAEGRPGHDVSDDRLVADDELLVLSDFGLAKDLVAASGMTISGGTPGFTAPEQLELGASVDHRADLFAASAVLIAVATGRPPAWRDGRPLDDEQERILGVMAPVLSRALRSDPDHRPADVAAWLDELEAVLATVDGPLDQEPSTPAASDDGDGDQADGEAPPPADHPGRPERFIDERPPSMEDGFAPPEADDETPLVVAEDGPATEAERPAGRTVSLIGFGVLVVLAVVTLVATLAARQDDDEVTAAERSTDSTSGVSTTEPAPSSTDPAQPDDTETPTSDTTETTEGAVPRLGSAADTPIVCSDHRGESATTPIGSDGPVPAASCTISTSGPGQLLIFATATAVLGSPFLEVADEPYRAAVSIFRSTDGGPTPVGRTTRSVRVDATRTAVTAATSTSLSVEAGLTTVGLAVERIDGGRPVLDDPAVTAIFVPDGSDLIRTCSDEQIRPFAPDSAEFGTDKTNLVAECGIDAPTEGTVMILATAVANDPAGEGATGTITIFDNDPVYEQLALGQRFELDPAEEQLPVVVVDSRPFSPGQHFVGLFAAKGEESGPTIEVDSGHVAAIWIAQDHPSADLCSAVDRKSLTLTSDEPVPLGRCRLTGAPVGSVAAFGAATVTGGPDSWADVWFVSNGVDPSSGGANRLVAGPGIERPIATAVGFLPPAATVTVELMGRTSVGGRVEVTNPGVVGLVVAAVDPGSG